MQGRWGAAVEIVRAGPGQGAASLPRGGSRPCCGWAPPRGRDLGRGRWARRGAARRQLPASRRGSRPRSAPCPAAAAGSGAGGTGPPWAPRRRSLGAVRGRQARPALGSDGSEPRGRGGPSQERAGSAALLLGSSRGAGARRGWLPPGVSSCGGPGTG